MKVFLFAFFAINLFLPLIAMEQAPSEKKLHEDYFPYLHLLPDGVLKNIAQYFSSRKVETDAEFLERLADKTKPLAFNDCISNLTYLNATFECEGLSVYEDDSQGNPCYAGIEWKLSVYNKNNTQKKFLLHEWTEQMHLTKNKIINYCVTAISWSPDLSKVLLYDNLHRGIIVNLYTNTKIKKYQFTLSSEINIEAMTVSCDGNYVAQVLRLPDSTLQVCLYKIDNDTCEKIVAIDKLDLPYVTALSFNNQGTQLMAYKHAIDKFCNDEYSIITLITENEHARESIKKLPEIFRQLGVCKNINP